MGGDAEQKRLARRRAGDTRMETPLDESMALTQKLYAGLITKPKLTTQLLTKPPVKFLRDVFVEVSEVTGFGAGTFSEDELANCWATRDSKLSFLSALLHVVAYGSGDFSLLQSVRVTKIAAGAEPEATNDLLQKLHYAATTPDARLRWDFAVKKASEPSSRLPQDCVLPPEMLARKLFSYDVPRERVIHFITALVDKAALIDTPAAEAKATVKDAAEKVTCFAIPTAPPASDTSLFDDPSLNDGQAAAAALKIQSLQRGKQVRKEIAHKKKSRARQSFIAESCDPILNHYEILGDKKLGEGSFGSVCQCRHKQTGQVFAVKTIQKSQVKDIDALRKEIDLMKELDHPNMIKLFATFEDSRCFSLVMEVCAGGELLERIVQGGQFSEGQCAAIMAQIFRACHYLHTRACLVHRDLKLENFLLSNDEEITKNNNFLKMIDFGEAKALNDDDAPLTTRVGTPFYVAPEVLRGSYNEKADLWSAGVIMFMLLGGYPPFPGGNPDEVTKNVMTGQFEFHDEVWSDISEDAKDLITKLLTMDPEKRLSAKAALAHPWVVQGAPRARIRRTETQVNLLSNLRSFHSNNQLQKLAMNALARSLNDKEIQELKDLFVALDENGDGQLTLEELNAGLGQAGLAEAAAKLATIMDECDADGNGVIDYTEFIAATVDKKRVMQEDACWQAFRMFDLDNSGRIDKTELSKVLDQEDVQEALHIDADSLKSILSEVDQDGDGEIDFDEFMTMMRGAA